MTTTTTDPSPTDTATGDPDEGENENEKENEDEEEQSESETTVDPAVQLINSGPLQTDQSVDSPVTSGNDAMLDDGS